MSSVSNADIMLAGILTWHWNVALLATGAVLYQDKQSQPPSGDRGAGVSFTAFETHCVKLPKPSSVAEGVYPKVSSKIMAAPYCHEADRQVLP